jgi:hypothetical protein
MVETAFNLESISMPLKLFILGRPGSGKSTVAAYIIKQVEEKGLQPVRINDYAFLYNEFQIELHQDKLDPEQARFRKTRNDGFDVRDSGVLDDALDYISQLAGEACATMLNDLVIIEFARSDYGAALKKFPSALLNEARFLFIETDVPTCIKRVKNRIANKNKSPDDTYISVKTFKQYYSKDNGLYMPFGFVEEFRLHNKQVRMIHNMGPIWDFEVQISEFSQIILGEISKLRETDPAQNISPIISNCQIAK